MRVAATTSRRQFLGSFTRASLAVAGYSCNASSGLGCARSVLNQLTTQNTHEGKPREGAIEFESSDPALVDGFRWAKAQALAYARNDGSIGPWYEASLPGRNAFCMRDVSHMSNGAQFLGLGSRTLNMLRRFAENISASKKWCTWWEITRDNVPAPVDYKNDKDFWYNLPANFDVLDACYRRWLWTRDSAYLDAPFLSYYRHTVTDYVQAWDHDRDGLADHLPGSGHMGIGSYDEDLQDEVLVGADLIAAQYAAYRAYASIERSRSESTDAAEFDRKADGLRSTYNSQWWDPKRNGYFDALVGNGKFAENMKESNGRSTQELPLYYGLTDIGFKTDAVLDELEKRLTRDEDALHGAVGGVEGRSYLPDIFYQYGRSRAGYRALTFMMNPALKRREYPEVSYTVIGNLGTGLMGIRPLPTEQTVETYPQLTEETGWAAVHHVPVGNNIVSVKHVKNRETSLTNESGPSLAWRGFFPGKFRALFSGNKEVPTTNTVRSQGTAETYSIIHVAPGETRSIYINRT
jgi:hypothetical protein